MLSDSKITLFRNEYAFLSNFYPSPIEWEGLQFPNVECAFHATKTKDMHIREEFVNLSPKMAKKKGRQLCLRADWEDIKVDVMRGLVWKKFITNQDLKEKLLATGDAELVEGNYWGDTFWGFDLRYGRGENHLGTILMNVREKLRKEVVC